MYTLRVLHTIGQIAPDVSAAAPAAAELHAHLDRWSSRYGAEVVEALTDEPIAAALRILETARQDVQLAEIAVEYLAALTRQRVPGR